MQEVYGVALPERPGDTETIAAPLDHLGLNYYFRQIIQDAPDLPAPSYRVVPVPDAPKRFGLIHVDFKTQQRMIKASGHRYAQLIADHRTATAFPA
ncbi:putative beta-glucosidase [Streptomyces ambofaciens ATCC 23877]|uniref:Putative beta-glucosidase n=1 Tax=Streptomyces ambofaciens (strain ATCC 23877 / 3486 / DSM 40053 / JCM 4204 / NBRC 12836 / NRRL B-2516) TaxID=278992 RepID=A0A0K2B5A2_STRA7|nr:putative beta-glucosidase [Streptomyces ambofaciens ATCC 23877]